MNQKLKSTTYDFTLTDGTSVPLTLNFFYLYQLKNNNRDLYDRYNKIMSAMQSKKDNFDVIDTVTICYVAYMCANQNAEKVLTEEEFYLLCGSDMQSVGKAINALIAPKKQ